LERQGVDLQTKIEELQIINQPLREIKIKEDALTHLRSVITYSVKEYTTVRKKTNDIVYKL
jgi:hypothetical protein